MKIDFTFMATICSHQEPHPHVSHENIPKQLSSAVGLELEMLRDGFRLVLSDQISGQSSTDSSSQSESTQKMKLACYSAVCEVGPKRYTIITRCTVSHETNTTNTPEII